MSNQKADRKELRKFILDEIQVAVKQSFLGILIATSIGAIISFTKEIELIASVNRWLYIIGIILILLATLPSNNLDYAYYSSAQTRAADHRRADTYDNAFRRFITAALVLLFAIILERIRQ